MQNRAQFHGKCMHGYCVQLAFEQLEYYAFSNPLDSMNFNCLFKPMAVIIAVSKTFDPHDGWCNRMRMRGNNRPKDVMLWHIKVKKDLIPFLFFSLGCSAKCRQHSLYTCKEASKRWKVNNFWWHLHILQYANELKLQNPDCQKREREMERKKKKKEKNREGAEWKREKQTEADVNYGCNLRFPREKERLRGTSSHAYQIMHLPHFLIMVREQTQMQSGLFVHMCVFVWDHLHIHPCQVSWCRVVLSAILKTWSEVCV